MALHVYGHFVRQVVGVISAVVDLGATRTIPAPLAVTKNPITRTTIKFGDSKPNKYASFIDNIVMGASSIVSDCSVLCSTATSATTQDCSTTCYSTATKCSATGDEYCFHSGLWSTLLPSFTACVGHPIKAKKTRRDLSEGTTDKSKNHLNKQTLTTPADYGGNTMQFLLFEYLWAEWLDINLANPNSRSTALARPLSNQRYDAAVHELYGCTSVVVVSQQAVWISHFWEIPSFRASGDTWG